MQKAYHAKIAKTAKNEAEVLILGADHPSLFGEWSLAVGHLLILAHLAFFA